jgi:Insertion element 4 transposase N-terminal
VSADPGEVQDPEKGSIGLLSRVFPRGVVGVAIRRAGVKGLKNRALPARLMVSFVVGILYARIRTAPSAAEATGQEG